MDKTDITNDYREVIDYMKKIGKRAKKTETNRAIYSELKKFIIECMNKNEDSISAKYFLDCVAQHILGVMISLEYTYGNKETLRVERYSKIFIQEYEKLERIKNRNRYNGKKIAE